MIRVDGVKYQLDRILRVTVRGRNTVVIEYCPLDDGRLNAHIDATIKYLPAVQSKNNRPGFSAKVTIFNPPKELIGLINKHLDWPIGKKSAKQYYNGRCNVTIDAGYWNHESTDGRDYTTVFSGWLNTSAYYRKNTDEIVEMYCHNIELTDQEISSLVPSRNVRLSGYQQDVYDSTKGESLYGTTNMTWQSYIENVIRRFETEKTPRRTLISTIQSQNMSLDNSRVTQADRDKGFTPDGWDISLQYIMPPQDVANPGRGAMPDESLRQEMVGQVEGINPKGMVANAPTFRGKMQQIAEYYPGTLRWTAVYSNPDGRTRYYFWRPSVGVDKSNYDASQAVRNSYAVVIYNFQNMLQAPSIDGAGCFHLKMMFNPKVRAGGAIELRWDDKFRSNAALLSETQGVSTSAQLGQFYPSLQGGRYNLQVYALGANYAKKNGDIFNTPFNVGYVTHVLSTHGSSWYTEVKTLSAMAQIQYRNS